MEKLFVIQNLGNTPLTGLTKLDPKTGETMTLPPIPIGGCSRQRFTQEDLAESSIVSMRHAGKIRFRNAAALDKAKSKPKRKLNLSSSKTGDKGKKE
jgi:hypothetical protein